MADVEGVPEDIIDEQVEDEMTRWRDQAAALASPVRAPVEQALDWLELRRPVEVSLCLCHGRFNPDTVFLVADEVSAVTMWDGARVTDASYDLATLRSDVDATGMGEDDAELFAQAAYGAYLQASPRGLANTAYYSVARPLAAILDGLATGDGNETDVGRHWSIIERAMSNAARVPWRA
jgi:hypothetical protein